MQASCGLTREEKRAIVTGPVLPTWWPTKMGWKRAQIGPKLDQKMGLDDGLNGPRAKQNEDKNMMKIK